MGSRMSFALVAFASVGLAIIDCHDVVAQTSASAPESFPAWAYPWVPDFKVQPDDGIPRHVPDSDAAFSSLGNLGPALSPSINGCVTELAS
jgi:hypothetical protein